MKVIVVMPCSWLKWINAATARRQRVEAIVAAVGHGTNAAEPIEVEEGQRSLTFVRRARCPASAEPDLGKQALAKVPILPRFPPNLLGAQRVHGT
ncbi:hypothetical protein [Rhodopila sp.]|uniref:hypothetical protein n=1 Tax=Rhodopila sp. TaxID=2480087 RepID=UPI003D14060E